MDTINTQQTPRNGAPAPLPLAAGSVPAIPVTTIEAIWHLSDGAPIDIPSSSLCMVLTRIEAYFRETDLDVEMRGKRTTITPIRCVLRHSGRTMLSQNNRDDRRRAPDSAQTNGA